VNSETLPGRSKYPQLPGNSVLPEKPRLIHHPLPAGLLDRDAVKVVRRLNRFGYSSFLVGGCLRDLLLGVKPKDFDVVTTAKPNEIKKLFRNCRLIGRRFRLAHLLFSDRKIIEVATFRRAPNAEEKDNPDLIGDNLFGTAPQDVLRRDFTINALLYEVRKGVFHDYVGGVRDIEKRLLRTIGDPGIRLPEDPVRILRAIKFASRLDLDLEPDLRAAMSFHAKKITDTCAAPRVSEEIFRMLRPGTGFKSIELAFDLGVLEHLFPELSSEMCNTETRNLVLRDIGRADGLIRRGRALSDAVLLSTLLWRPLERIIRENRNSSSAVENFIKPITLRFQIPRRVSARLRQICLARRRLMNPHWKRSRALVKREYFRESVDHLEITATDSSENHVLKIWSSVMRGEPFPPSSKLPDGKKRSKKRRKKRRSGKNKPLPGDKKQP